MLPAPSTSKRPRPRRREILKLAGSTAASVGLAGCLGTDDAADPPPNTAPTTTTVDEATTATTAGSTGTATATTATPIHAAYDTTEVRVTTADGTVLGAVTAAIADTPQLRFTGLSDTESLPPDRGMLFVFAGVGDRTFVMREMDFGIDIVYADASGTITRIHHAPAPGPDEDGSEQTYPGRGKYVLEVTLDWTTDHGVEPGHRLEFEL